jgi:peptidoglycan/LPS O-acetylase OafA/YrhL
MPGARYIPALDGIRGIAIVMVIAFHFGLFEIDTHSLFYTVYRSTVELGCRAWTHSLYYLAASLR